MGRKKMLGAVTPFKLEFRPMLFKELMVECGISQGEIAEACGVSRPAVNLMVNHNYIPKKPGFQGHLEQWLTSGPKRQTVTEWLAERSLRVGDIWGNRQDETNDLRRTYPNDFSIRNRQAQLHRNNVLAMQPGNPDQINSMEVVEMLDPRTLKHFKLFRTPFGPNAVQKPADIYKDDDHRYIEYCILDAARNNGFIAVVGEVGSGKSTIRKLVVDQIRREGDIQVVYPEIVDKDRITSSSLLDAIIMSISSEAPKIKHEQKARQVRRLLQERSQQGNRCCLMIEEAHGLNVKAFKSLKQIYEMEDITGFRKLTSIILIGQTELGEMLDERYHPEMREVIRRCQVARIEGMSNCREYLEHKFRQVGGKVEAVFCDDSLTVLQKRLTVTGELGKPVSNAYPLTVELYATRAMNLACELGEPKVSAEVVEAI